jgi:serine-type D-Ala-D-Ala carboxypeptidase/endopeptidase (penicillin-binding protein 4)
MRSRPFLLAVCLFFGLPLARAELPPPVQAALAAAAIPEDAMAALVVRLPDGAPLLAHREKASMQPASTLKLLTSLVALETLGPGYRAKTRLRGAEIVDGVMRGDLVLQGGGDVDLDWQAFERMLWSLRLQGVREIQGNFVLDLSSFRPARTDVGLAPFDDAPEFRYNLVPDALLLNSYLVSLDLVSRGTHVAIRSQPALSGVSFVSAFDLVDRECDDWEDGWKIPEVTQKARGAITVRLRGEYPRNCKASTSIAVLDRVVFADRLFRALWTGMGGKFRGRTREGSAVPDAPVLAEHLSRPLSEIVRDINKRSDNPITRVVYLALGTKAGVSEGTTTFDSAQRMVREWLVARGIESDGLLLENGSGLSRTERIRPDQLAAVLQAAAKSRWAPEFLASLPIVAVDGGMRNRLKKSPAAQQARIKTGTLRDVSAVAGYVEDARGIPHIVVAMINHERATRKVARPILDALLDWVARSN